MKTRRIAMLLLTLAMIIYSASCLADLPVQTEGITIPVIEDMKEFKIP